MKIEEFEAVESEAMRLISVAEGDNVRSRAIFHAAAVLAVSQAAESEDAEKCLNGILHYVSGVANLQVKLQLLEKGGRDR